MHGDWLGMPGSVGMGGGAVGTHQGAGCGQGSGQGHSRQIVDDAGAGEQRGVQPVICKRER